MKRGCLVTCAVLVLIVLLVVAFMGGVAYGHQQTMIGVKQWWRERGRNTHNPHYRVTP